MLAITSLYAGCLALVYLILAGRVINQRRIHSVSLGDGGNKVLRQRIQAHENAGEYIPIGLVLLACLEIQGASALTVHVLGSMLLAGRVLHGLAFAFHPMIMPVRLVSMVLTLLMILFAGAGLLIQAVS